MEIYTLINDISSILLQIIKKGLLMLDFKNIKIKAVIFGFLSYFGVSIVIGGVLGFITSMSIMKSGGFDPQDPESMKAMQAAMFEDSTFLIGTLLITLVGALLAGYVAAKTAKIAEVTNALIVGITLILIGLIFTLVSSTPMPLWITATSWILMLGGLYGGAVLGTSEPAQPAA